MKKSIITLIMVCFLIFSASAFAQTFHTANQKTVAWDAVTTTTGGSSIDPAEISYEVYLSNATTDPEKSNPVMVGTTTETQHLITLGVEGKYFVGIKAIRTVAGEVVSESYISWSDASVSDFGLQYFESPADPSGLRLP